MTNFIVTPKNKQVLIHFSGALTTIVNYMAKLKKLLEFYMFFYKKNEKTC